MNEMLKYANDRVLISEDQFDELGKMHGHIVAHGEIPSRQFYQVSA